jgi:glycosyltransferase involved in cell wall biosynthesis
MGAALSGRPTDAGERVGSGPAPSGSNKMTSEGWIQTRSAPEIAPVATPAPVSPPQDAKKPPAATSLVLNIPLDGMKIASHVKRERAWRRLALRLYNEQPSFMKRGKGRFDALVNYDPVRDVITWDGHALPNTKCWKTNCKVGERFGKVVLALMVKNESKIIERMLASIIDDIDGFVILDTGSTDGTQQLMWDFLTKHGKRGAIYSSPFWDFSSCRTITVQLAHQTGDFLLLMDADYQLVKSGGLKGSEWRSKLPSPHNAPLWLLLETTGNLAYSRPHLVLGAVRWFYACRTHEYLSQSSHDKSGHSHGISQENFPYLQIDHVGDGGSKADKFPRDIVLLLMDMMDDPRSDRSPFYLGNTLKTVEMYEWALRSYKAGMNLCGWREEQYCAAKGALECMYRLKCSQERQLGMVLHAITQDPDRLELLCEYVMRIRSTKELHPKLAHMMSSLCGFYTHNTYPRHEKLFVQRWEHDVGFWQEATIVSYFCPSYFELGTFTSHKLINNKELLEAQNENVRKTIKDNHVLFTAKADALRKTGLLMTRSIRLHLLESAHRLFARGQWARAFETYQVTLHGVVPRDAVNPSLWPSDPVAEARDRQDVNGHIDALSSEKFHRFHRLTAWQSAKSLTPIVSEHDQDRALACCQMAKCQERVTHNDHLNKLIVAFYYVDALKFVPGYPMALASLYDISIMMPSAFTRCIMYLLRLVGSSPVAIAAGPLIRSLDSVISTLNVTQSLWVAVKRSQVTGSLSHSLTAKGRARPTVGASRSFASPFTLSTLHPLSLRRVRRT